MTFYTFQSVINGQIFQFSLTLTVDAHRDKLRRCLILFDSYCGCTVCRPLFSDNLSNTLTFMFFSRVIFPSRIKIFVKLLLVRISW